MNLIKKFLTRLRIKLISHKWAILLALITAVIIAYPQVYLRWDLADSYYGIELLGASDDEEAWMTRIREVQDGHPFFASAYFKEGKNDPYLFQPLGTMMAGYLGKLFSLDINNTVLLSRFFFSFLIFLIIYSFLLLFTREKLIALSISLAFLLAKPLFEALFARHLFIQTNFLNLARPVNPALTWFFFFGFLLFFWLFLERKQWRWGILSILTLGLSFYDYFYTWTFLYVFLGIIILIFLFQKKWFDAKRTAIVLLASAIIALPWFLNLYQVLSHPNYQDVGQRFGLVEGRFFAQGFLVLFLFINFLLFFPKKEKERFFFALALLITPFIILNQQLITSKSLSIDHYHWYYHKPLAIIFLLITLFFWLSQKKWQFLKKPLAILVIIISLGNGIFVQSISYAHNRKVNIEKQEYGPVMDWLNQNAEKDEVVLTNNDKAARLIIIYTPLNLFYHPSAGLSLSATKERLLDILFLFYRLGGVGAEESQKIFLEDKRNISSFMYGMYYRYTAGDESGIPDEIILDFSQKYRDSLTLPTADFIEGLFDKYEIKYVVWDKETNPSWQFDQYSFLKKAAEIGDFTIYAR